MDFSSLEEEDGLGTNEGGEKEDKPNGLEIDTGTVCEEGTREVIAEVAVDLNSICVAVEKDPDGMDDRDEKEAEEVDENDGSESTIIDIEEAVEEDKLDANKEDPEETEDTDEDMEM